MIHDDSYIYFHLITYLARSPLLSLQGAGGGGNSDRKQNIMISWMYSRRIDMLINFLSAEFNGTGSNYTPQIYNSSKLSYSEWAEVA